MAGRGVARDEGSAYGGRGGGGEGDVVWDVVVFVRHGAVEECQRVFGFLEAEFAEARDLGAELGFAVREKLGHGGHALR